jgi:hypothetical protein
VSRVVVGTEDGLVEVGSGRLLVGREVADVVSVGADVLAVADGRVHRIAPQPEELGRPDGHTVNCLLTSDGEVIVGSDRARLFRMESGDFESLRGFDDAPGRDGWYTPWGGPPDTRSLASDGDLLYANVHVGGLLRSLDGGETWEQTIDPDTDVHEVVATDGLVVAALGAGGVAVSRDRAATWEMVTDGLHATYCRAVVLSGEMILVSASTGPRGDRAAVYRRSRDGDEPFDRCTSGLPEWFVGNVDTRCLAGMGTTVYIGTASGELYRSGNEGATWELVADRLATVRCVRLLDGESGSIS